MLIIENHNSFQTTVYLKSDIIQEEIMNHNHIIRAITNTINETLTPWPTIYTKRRSSNSVLICHLNWLQSMHSTQITVMNSGCIRQFPLYKGIEGNEKEVCKIND